MPSPGLRTLAELSRDAGYATAAFVSSAPLKRGSGIEAGFDVFDQPDRTSGEPAVDSLRLASLPVGLMGTPELVEPRRGLGPASLDGAPLLAPARSTSLRRDLDRWFDARNLVPQNHRFAQFDRAKTTVVVIMQIRPANAANRKVNLYLIRIGRGRCLPDRR